MIFYKNGGKSVIAVCYMIGPDSGQSDIVLFVAGHIMPGGL